MKTQQPATSGILDEAMLARVRRIGGAVVFLLSLVALLSTAAPTVTFWDSGEFITVAATMSNPHPPGAPLYVLLGRMFSLLPLSSDVAFRITTLSVVASALTVLFLYLTTMRLLRMWIPSPPTMSTAVGMILASASGALVLSFSDTFWFNGTESEVYNIGLCFIAAVVWMVLEWYTHSGMFARMGTLLLASYLIGLSVGVHLLSVLVVVFVVMMVMLRDVEKRAIRAIGIATMSALAALVVMYPGVVRWIPMLLATTTGAIAVAVLLLTGLLFATRRSTAPVLRFMLAAVLLAVLGFTTYTTVLVRAHHQPPINEGSVTDIGRLSGYLSRDWYKGYPLLSGPTYNQGTGTVDSTHSALFPRRWSPLGTELYAGYSSDLDFFLRYQLGHMYLRYFLWNFVGRSSAETDAPAVLLAADTPQPAASGYPSRLFGIPLVLGLIGLVLHFRRDWRTGTAFTSLFLILGLGLVVYFNNGEREPRELDYFFVGSFHVFALWIGVGVSALGQAMVRVVKRPEVQLPVGAVVGIGTVVLVFTANLPSHDRSANLWPYDFSYNLLQSCESEAIYFAGGDNDAYPLWYLQYVEGIRRDVRMVNLGVLEQIPVLKELMAPGHGGTAPVELTLTNDQLANLTEAGQWSTLLSNYRFDHEGGIVHVTFKVPMCRDIDALMAESPEIAAMFADVAQQDSVTMRLTIPATTSIRTFHGLQPRDLLLLDIIRRNMGTRPLHFSRGIDDATMAMLHPWLVTQGLTYRLLPVPAARPDGYRTTAIASMRAHLENLQTEPVPTRAPGFLFRAAARGQRGMDEVSQPMINTYRFLYMNLANDINVVLHDQAAGRRVLRTMERVFPSTLHPTGAAMDFDTGMLMLAIRDTAGVRARSALLEARLRETLAKAAPEARGSTYITLVRLFQLTDDRLKEGELITTLEGLYPGDTLVARFRRDLTERSREIVGTNH